MPPNDLDETPCTDPNCDCWGLEDDDEFDDYGWDDEYDPDDEDCYPDCPYCT